MEVACTLSSLDGGDTGGMRWAPRLLASTAPVQTPGPLVDTVDDAHMGRTLRITGGLGSLGVLFALYGLHQVQCTFFALTEKTAYCEDRRMAVRQCPQTGT